MPVHVVAEHRADGRREGVNVRHHHNYISRIQGPLGSRFGEEVQLLIAEDLDLTMGIVGHINRLHLLRAQSRPRLLRCDVHLANPLRQHSRALMSKIPRDTVVKWVLCAGNLRASIWHAQRAMELTKSLTSLIAEECEALCGPHMHADRLIHVTH